MIKINSILTIFSSLRSLLLIVVASVFSACSAAQSIAIEKYIGLYQVVSSKCDVIDGEVDPCKSTHFIEIVKGQFIGIADSELAYVFWSGDPKLDPELQYEAHLIKANLQAKADDGNFFLNADNEAKEYFTVANDQLTEYTATYVVGRQKKIRAILYALKKVERGNLPFVRLNYPGNK